MASARKASESDDGEAPPSIARAIELLSESLAILDKLGVNGHVAARLQHVMDLLEQKDSESQP